MENSTQETMTYQQRYPEKRKKSGWKKVNGIMKKTKRGYK